MDECPCPLADHVCSGPRADTVPSSGCCAEEAWAQPGACRAGRVGKHLRDGVICGLRCTWWIRIHYKEKGRHSGQREMWEKERRTVGDCSQEVLGSEATTLAFAKGPSGGSKAGAGKLRLEKKEPDVGLSP